MGVDLVLGGTLVVLAVGAIFAKLRLACVLLFIAFGLLMAVAWVRLEAIDLALAEAVIGAGLTGTLLLHALAQSRTEGAALPSHKTVWLAGAGVAVLVALVMFQVLPRMGAPQDHGLPLAKGLVPQELPSSGVTHPVTAVLLNFRAWDTLLELAVVLLALIGIRQLQPSPPVAIQSPWPLLLAWSKILAPVLFIVSAYLLWRGKSAPGGAFQAGALLAAAAVLLRLSGALPPLPWSSLALRTLALIGLGLFVFVGLGGIWLGEGWLHFPHRHASALILCIEAAATLSIALALSLMTIGDAKDLHQ